MDDQQISLPHAQSTEEPPPVVKDDSNNITEPHPNDVLCGRGGMTDRHVGNAHWRSLVAANKRLYLKLPKRQKMLVSESIVKTVRSQDPPGRFLKLDKQTKVWTDVGDRKAISKTSRALRESGGKVIAEETMEPQSLAQVTATPNVNAGVTAGALTEQQRVQQVLTQQEQQAMMPPPPPRLPQQPQQAQPQPEIAPVQEQLQTPAQIQYQISQIAFLLKQLEMQVQGQGMQITPQQQAQYTFLMQQQQTLAQMLSLAQQQEQLALQQQQMMQQSVTSVNADDQQNQNEKPTPGSKAQKRLSQEDLARWTRVKAMLAKTSSIPVGTGDTNAAHVSHPGSIHGQSSGAAAPLPAAASAAGADAHDAPTRNQPQTSLNCDVSMMSTLSGLSGILSVGEAGNFGLERGDTRGNGTVDMTDMMTRNISAAMSEMSLSRGPSLSMTGDIFDSIVNGDDSGLAPGSLTGLGDDDDDDDNDEREEKFKGLRNTSGTGAAASKPPHNKSSEPNNNGAGNAEG